MAEASFIHLAVHTAYSLSEGAIQIDDLVCRVVDCHMPAVAMTDSNNLFGALEFSTTLADAGIQPIIGCALAFKNPHMKEPPGGGAMAPDILRLYARNETGYGNLLKLVSAAHLESDGHESPQVTIEALADSADGLICLSGGVKGPLGHLIVEGQGEQAEMLLDELAAVFPGSFYLEIMRHGLPEEESSEGAFLDLAYDKNLPLVATNDAHFLDADMFEAHDALLCIADGTYVTEPDRRQLTPDHRFKSAAEMQALFADLPEAIENTVEIARRCSFAPATRDPILPNFASGSQVSESELLKAAAEKGLGERLKDMDAAARQPYEERLDHELKVISKMGYAGYFLIVADFIQWARDHGVPVGPGRGSGAGSLVAWALKITDIDPLKFGLLFERFWNPERASMPDFDVDFCQEKREQVIRYVQDKYGADHVAQIITFGTLQARQALRDVGRVQQLPHPVTDRLCKMIPNDPANPVSLAQAIKEEPRLRQERKSDPAIAAVLDKALKLEGLYRHASTHAAGVVIGDRPLNQLLPLYRDPRSDMPVTQFSMKWAEKAGLVKFDFLGLKTLTVLSRALDMLRERDIEVDLDRLPLDDEATFALLQRADTAGVFQLESTGMRSALKNLRPDKFEDVIAIVALYRPGPMQNIPSYIARKHGDEEIDYLHEWLKPVLDETYGVIIYQEQVMQIAQILAGYSLGEADILRRAMGKKNQKEMDDQQARFVQGAHAKGVDEARARFIFDLVAKFAGYGFNKSHAAAYGWIAYQTAYLKANYPAEFMAATMTLDKHNTDKLAWFKAELKRSDIPLLPPAINVSGVDFIVEKVSDAVPDDPRAGLGIRYALSATKNVGEKAMVAIVAEREANGPFGDMFDFAERMDVSQVNKRQLEYLIMAGAFDGLNPNRAELLAGAEMILRHAHLAEEARSSQQESLFGEGVAAIERPMLPEVAPWNMAETVHQERNAIGFYLTAHPLELFEELMTRKKVISFEEAMADDKTLRRKINLAGAIESFRVRRSAKSGKHFAYMGLSDLAGSYEVLVFSDLLDAASEAVEAGGPVLIAVSMDKRDEDDIPRPILRSISSLETVAGRSAPDVQIYLRDAKVGDALARLLEDHRGGRARVRLSIITGDEPKEVTLELADKHKMTPLLLNAIKATPGVVDVREI